MGGPKEGQYEVNLTYDETDVSGPIGFEIEFRCNPGKNIVFKWFWRYWGNNNYKAYGDMRGLTIDELYQQLDAMKKNCHILTIGKINKGLISN